MLVTAIKKKVIINAEIDENKKNIENRKKDKYPKTNFAQVPCI